MQQEQQHEQPAQLDQQERCRSASPTETWAGTVRQQQVQHEQHYQCTQCANHTCSAATAYDLEACDHHEVDEERYYTLSSAGVTSFASDASQFTSLERWEHEFRMFHLVHAAQLGHRRRPALHRCAEQPWGAH